MKSSLWKLPDEQDNDIVRLCDFDVGESNADIKVRYRSLYKYFSRSEDFCFKAWVDLCSTGG